MFNSQRLKGLEMLSIIGAPVPEWQVVLDLEDVGDIKLPNVDFGWTIRTCRTDGIRESGLFYLNNATPDMVIRVINDRLHNFKGIEFYIVYPSWKFIFSANVVLDDQIYILEGKYGSQKDLAIGKSIPDFGIQVPLGIRSQMVVYLGKPSYDVSHWLGRILWWCRKIPFESFYSEVALIHDSTLVFYELFNLGVK